MIPAMPAYTDPRDRRAAARMAEAAARIAATNGAARLSDDPMARELAAYSLGILDTITARLDAAPADGLTLPLFPQE